MKKKILLLVFQLTALIGYSHPMPNSVVLFDIGTKEIHCELQLPIKELQLAVPFDVTVDTADILKKHKQQLSDYILKHFFLKDKNDEVWNASIKHLKIGKAEQTATGVYQELLADLVFEAKDLNSIRNFKMFYDVIIHQVVTHKALITIRQDWENGKIGEDNTQIGIIGIDIASNTVKPIRINLKEGGIWKGFRSMMSLGMEHIEEGTDHLLFLLVLLMSAPMIAESKKWTKSGGIKFSFYRILNISLAFTLGHSVTLMLGTFGWFHAPAKIIEMLIAFSILVTAVHIVRPIFSNQEVYVAAFFGLIHGLAFAAVLANLHLDSGRLIISLAGFNIGIELMQLFVISMVMPWLLLLSKDKIYRYVQVSMAVIAATASLAWIVERYTEKSNMISEWLEKFPQYSSWIVLFLIGLTILNYVIQKAFLLRETSALSTR